MGPRKQGALSDLDLPTADYGLQTSDYGFPAGAWSLEPGAQSFVTLQLIEIPNAESPS